MQSSYQQSSAIPNGPSSSSNNTRNSKLDQIIQNFYTKTAQIIIQSRCTTNEARYGKKASYKGSSSKKLNKWFNVATEDVEILREDLKYWRNMAVQTTAYKEPPPMIIDIYLNTSKLSFNPSLVVADDNLRWGYVELKSQITDTHIDRILIESWELTLNHPFPDYPVDLPNLYKKCIVFFRSLHTITRLLPGYDLYRKLYNANDSSNLLSIGYRLSSSTAQKNNSEIPIESSILESDARKPTKLYEFSEIVTPIGIFKLHVNYRRNCDFRIEDTERDLSAQFIDMDEQFFTPTMLKYKQEQQQLLQQKQKQHSDYSIRSTTSTGTVTRPSSTNSNSSKSTTPRSSIDYRLENPLKHHATTDPREIRPPLSKGGNTFIVGSSGSNSIRNESPSTSNSTSRRASAAFIISPFKSPFLSSSPQAESIFSSGGGLAKIQPDNKYRASPLMLHSNSSTSSTAADHPNVNTNATDSSSFSRKIEFSSSFEKYKSSSPTRTVDSPSNASIMMMKRLSRTSDHTSSSIYLKEYENNADDDLEDFVRLVRSNQELRMFSSMSVTASSTSSPKRLNLLSHFQNLRETHNSLSDSLSSSIMLGTANQQKNSEEENTATSPISSTSSTGRSYQPTIPSPLHAEQRSTTPIHIPRSFPQLRSLSSTQNALRLARLNTNDDKHNHDISYIMDDENNRHNDISAYSTYPQDHYRQELYLLRNNNYPAFSECYPNRIAKRRNSEQPEDKLSSHQDFSKKLDDYYDDDDDDGPLYHYRSQHSNINESSHLMQDNHSSTTTMNQSERQQKANNSLMDDDDSLVFKMSELECSESNHSDMQQHPGIIGSTSSQQPTDMLYNNNTTFLKNTTTTTTAATTTTTYPSLRMPSSPPTFANNNRVNEQYLELTPTPLSPPLLHRLQTISIPTEEERKEERNNKVKNVKPTSSLPFDGW
ncbi:autophagy-related protein 13-domain-containing protein [Cokeromyces recurvatus]|uniref:autophagy-related protein 13-domain-containing protein n=1 Tax=Cokeromyces recurvatus TaxID=90255 RepID=UPI002220B1DE|nr:autophagy-related protein 13-domain-containing protein [Cokeromyces recurvatus]KAI7906082.1 autophagy-related protein 13-domain-containing protein [Cokeromyces recurvatus]